MSDDVFAVIVAHRDIERAERCAASLGLPTELVVIVANVAPAQQTGVPWQVASPASAQGYAANINLGASRAPDGTRWLLLLNDDIVFEHGTLERLVAAAVDDVDIGAITPALHGEKGRPQAIGFHHPTISSEIANVLVGPQVLRGVLRRAPPIVGSSSGITYVDWVLGAAVLVRAEAFAAVCGFDERYFLYSEDTQFGLDLERAGWRSAVLHDARALHVGATSTSDARWREMLIASRHRYLRTNWPRPRFAALCVLWLGAQLWNVAYLAPRGVADPRGRASRAAQARVHRRCPPWRMTTGP